MRKLLLLCAVSLLLVFPVVANATPITADLTGTRSTSNDTVVVSDGWNRTNVFNGFEISWDITPTTTGDGTISYSYQYTISGEGGDNLSKGLSHWILEVTGGSFANDFTMITANAVDSYYGALSATSIPFEAPATFIGTDETGDNPYMPSSIYGIKWDTDSIFTDPNLDDTKGLDIVKFVINFTTAKDPVWGDFYAKDGTQGGQGEESDIWATAYNLEFGTGGPADGTIDFTSWIARPNGGGGGDDSIPEPATMLLLGSGLIGLAVTGKKKFKKRNG